MWVKRLLYCFFFGLSWVISVYLPNSSNRTRFLIPGKYLQPNDKSEDVSRDAELFIQMTYIACNIYPILECLTISFNT